MNHLPQTKNQIKNVSNFEELISTPFQGEINAMCWNRNLVGDFSEIVKKITLTENITALNTEELLELQLSEQGQLAREVLLNDLSLLKAH